MRAAPLLALAALAAAAPSAPPSPGPAAWRALAPGVEHARVRIEAQPRAGDGFLDIVRIDPAKAPLRAFLSHRADEAVPAARWARDKGLVAVINAGMYAQDHVTHVGYARQGDRVASAKWPRSYQSALAFGPRRAGLPPAAIVDLDGPGARERLDGYDTVLQNLRILKGKGVNVWEASPRAWSEAAVAADGRGRILFLFSRTPLTMRDFGDRLLALGLGIERAMHMEGGPEASLSVHGGGVDLDLNGCLETGFVESESREYCGAQWPLPNVVGVEAPRAP